jgi:hypothetical protein
MELVHTQAFSRLKISNQMRDRYELDLAPGNKGDKLPGHEMEQE